MLFFAYSSSACFLITLSLIDQFPVLLIEPEYFLLIIIIFLILPELQEKL